MNPKIIFLDIDGTLISELSAPSAAVTDAIRAARRNGHKVCLCTGRNMPIIGEDILEIGFDGIVASAGAHVEVKGEVLFDSLLPESLVQECLTVFHRHNVYCRIETPEGIYTDIEMELLLKTARPDKSNSELIRMQKELEGKLPVFSYEAYPGKGAYKMCMTCTDISSLEEAKKFLGDRFTFVVHPFGNKGCINGEIIPKEIDKGKGMKLVCGYYGTDLEDTIAFGDSMNDYEMLKTAGTGIAMGNACEELKAAADLVCESVWEDGICHGFKRLGLFC